MFNGSSTAQAFKICEIKSRFSSFTLDSFFEQQPPDQQADPV